MSETTKSEIKLVPALKEDKAIVQNLGRFYVYDMSRYCGFLKGWETPSNGPYECIDLSRYWDEPNRYPFLIQIMGKLLHKFGKSPFGLNGKLHWRKEFVIFQMRISRNSHLINVL